MWEEGGAWGRKSEREKEESDCEGKEQAGKG